MHIDARIINQIIANWIAQHVKKIIYLVEFIAGFARMNHHMKMNATHYINRMKENNHVLISIDKEKAFQKFQHLFMINSL